MPKITTLLMFEGKAEEAINFYISIFDNSKIISISRYGANEAGEKGNVARAIFSLNGQEFMCTDSVVKHPFTFTPAMSLFVTFDTEDEINRVFAKLSEDGSVLMPLSAYPFSPKFGWVNDKFGVSWQLSLTSN